MKQATIHGNSQFRTPSQLAIHTYPHSPRYGCTPCLMMHHQKRKSRPTTKQYLEYAVAMVQPDPIFVIQGWRGWVSKKSVQKQRTLNASCMLSTGFEEKELTNPQVENLCNLYLLLAMTSTFIISFMNSYIQWVSWCSGNISD